MAGDRIAVDFGPMSRTEEYDKFEDYLHTKVEDGVVSMREMEAVLMELVNTVHEAGSTRGGPGDESYSAVLRQATHRMKRVLANLHPELADEVRNLSSHRAR